MIEPISEIPTIEILPLDALTLTKEMSSDLVESHRKRLWGLKAKEEDASQHWIRRTFEKNLLCMI